MDWPTAGPRCQLRQDWRSPSVTLTGRRRPACHQQGQVEPQVSDPVWSLRAIGQAVVWPSAGPSCQLHQDWRSPSVTGPAQCRLVCHQQGQVEPQVSARAGCLPSLGSVADRPSVEPRDRWWSPSVTGPDRRRLACRQKRQVARPVRQPSPWSTWQLSAGVREPMRPWGPGWV